VAELLREMAALLQAQGEDNAFRVAAYRNAAGTLVSNTARAHELGRARDWVVLYVAHAARHEHQYTVVTASRGTLVGRRIVRGREDECRAFHAPNTQETS